MPTYHLHIRGRVQGVGFRPYIYNRFVRDSINGWVYNGKDGVHTEFNCAEDLVNGIVEELIKNAPENSRISNYNYWKIASSENFSSFEIKESSNEEGLDLSITPDFAICTNCKTELNDDKNRRFNYAFTTCTNCGPRYSIINRLPFDRHTTEMSNFPMCENCRSEYEDPTNRRYYAQTNSCSECGIEMLGKSRDGEQKGNREAISDAVNKIKAGKVVAVKGIGGYVLLCSSSEPEVLKTLRKRKQRPHKPFAVLFQDIQSLRKLTSLNDEEVSELSSPEAPIVLIRLSEALRKTIDVSSVAPGLDQLGVMLPSSPLLQLIADQVDEPLVCTSANESGMPILFEEDEKSELELFKYADTIISHNRNISMPQDDSVVKFSPRTKHKIVLRRSRGMAPNIATEHKELAGKTLALGAELKSTFSVSATKNTYVSHYLGNLEGYECQTHFSRVLDHFLSLTNIKPEQILVDKHPLYYSREIGSVMSDSLKANIEEIQHHKAHFAAILGEYKLEEATDPILGVIWDGTGYGDDGQIWGGEFFDFRCGEIDRIGHLKPFKVLGGDRMSSLPAISAFSLLNGQRDVIDYKFSTEEYQFYSKAIKNSGLTTTSMGRVFDAVAYILGLTNENTFEGMAAMLLEQSALKYYDDNDWKTVRSLPYEIVDGVVKLDTLFYYLLAYRNPKHNSELAARFHQTLVSVIKEIADTMGYQHIAFSGGVFQNGLLVDLINIQMGEDYKLYFHKELSPNDENISYGQLVHKYISEKRKEVTQNEKALCV
ncbi:MAG: carbamoyltransferase HypF [Bacteroidota bacterium]